MRRAGQAQAPLQQDLARGAAQQVGAAHDVGDALGGIVDHDRQLICEQTVATAQDEVTDRRGKSTSAGPEPRSSKCTAGSQRASAMASGRRCAAARCGHQPG